MIKGNIKSVNFIFMSLASVRFQVEEPIDKFSHLFEVFQLSKLHREMNRIKAQSKDFSDIPIIKQNNQPIMINA